MTDSTESSHPQSGGQAPLVVPARGIVLALNFVPEKVEPGIHAFWQSASTALQAQGHSLVIASTTPMDPALNSLPVPYLLTEFTTRYGASVDLTSAALPCPLFERKVQDWYGCDQTTARTSIQFASAFLNQLITAMRPAAVIAWQSTNPLSQLLLAVARSHSLPTWSAERGWIPHTLMFDVAENNHLSEVGRSLVAQSLMNSYSPGRDELDEITQRLLADKSGRYEAAQVQSGADLRQRLGIAPEAKVFALFTHGEPFLFAGDSTLAELHGLSRDNYLALFQDIKRYCTQGGHYLLVQEHPFNRDQPHEFSIQGEPGVIAVRENVHTLLDAADHAIFTLSTVQAYAVAYKKSFGILAKSFLHDSKGPYYQGDYSDAHAFMEAIAKGTDWPSRHATIEKRMAFYLKHFLLDISPDQVSPSAHRFASLIKNFERPLRTDLDEAINEFLQVWAT